MRIPRRFLAAAAAVPLLASAMVVLTPGVAEAVTCGQSWSDKDKSGSGFPDGPGSPGEVTLRSGIYGDCASRGTTYGIRLWYHCYRANSYGHTWTNVRIDGTNVNGWVYDAYLDDGGSTVAC
jgi:hypothetical protein